MKWILLSIVINRGAGGELIDVLCIGVEMGGQDSQWHPCWGGSAAPPAKKRGRGKIIGDKKKGPWRNDSQRLEVQLPDL